MPVLPKPKELKKQPDASAIVASKERIRKLAAEESRLIRSINDKRAEIKEVEDRLKEVNEEGQPRLLVRKTVLEEEVATLEARRRDAQKPVDLKLQEIAAREANISDTVQEALAISDKNAEESKRLEAMAKAAEAKEETANALLKSASKRNKDSEDAAEELRGMTKAFAKERAEAIAEQDERQKELDREARRLQERDKALDERKAGLDKEEKRLKDEDTRIRDGYRNLEAARKEILGK